MNRSGLTGISFNKEQMALKCLKLIGKLQLHCPGIGKDTDDLAVVSDSALYGTSVAANAVETRLRMYA